MATELLNTLMQKIQAHRAALTPKGRMLSEQIIANPRKVVFMSIRDFAEYCGVSEATVVRFVGQLGFKGYNDFQQALREVVDVELTLLERLDFTDINAPGGELFNRLVHEEIENLKRLHETMDLNAADRVVNMLWQKRDVYVIGSRLSYTFAYYLGWSLGKVRPGVQILRGSDTTTIDQLTIAPPGLLAVLLATTRYPNDLLRLAKVVRRLDHTLVVIADGSNCPLIQFAHESLVVPPSNIPFISNPSALSCLINFLVQQLASMLQGDELTAHQSKLEHCFLENDLLFNLTIENDTKKLTRIATG